ncbi:MAG: hypothetical protein HY343_08720 [Lentisphaerae bacterium]|nr:hypothetical protein [Lentisphaerota bacterium]
MKRTALMELTGMTVGVLLFSTLTLAAAENTADSAAPAKSQTATNPPAQTPRGVPALPPKTMGERKIAVPAGGTNAMPHGAIPPDEYAEFYRKAQENSIKTMELKKKISERRAAIMETNPTIKELLVRLQDMQKQINAIVDADPELAKLKTRYEILWTVQPDMPKGAGLPFNPNMMPRQGPGAAFNPKPGFGTNAPMLMPFGPAKAPADK